MIKLYTTCALLIASIAIIPGYASLRGASALQNIGERNQQYNQEVCNLRFEAEFCNDLLD